MKKILALWMLLLIFFSANAQNTLNGRVENEKGQPLIGANVVIENTFVGMPTDQNGKFSFDGLKPGNYELKVSYLGYQPISRKITLPEKYLITITMKPSAVLADEVIVSATRAGDKTPVAYSDVTKKSIEEQNMGQDIPYLLSMTPSLVTTSDAGTGIGYTGFRIRGTDANRINVTVNGIPVNDAESHGVYWVDLPDLASSLQNVQVQRGVGTSTNGAGAFGATINMQTNNLNKDAYAEVNSSAGSFNTFKNTVSAGTGLLNGKFSFDARLSKITSDGYIDRGWSDLKSYYVSGGYYTARSILKVNIFSGVEKTYQAWYGIPSDMLATNRRYNPAGEYTDSQGKVHYYNNETDNYWQDNYQLLYSHRFNEYLNLNAALHYTYGRGYYEEYKPDQNFSDYLMTPPTNVGTQVQSTDLVRRKWLDNDFYGTTFSLNYDKAKNNMTLGGAWNQYDGRHFGKVIWAQYYGENPINHQWYYSTGLKTDYNIYGKLNHQFSSRLNAYIDIQYRHISYKIDGNDDDLRDLTQNHYFDFFNPKVGLYYSPNDHNKLYVSFAKAHREPNRSNYKDADPNGPVPTSETLNDYEAGYNFRSTNFAFGINLYFMDYVNQLILTGEINDVGSAIMTNAPDSYRAGIELTGGWRICKSLRWDANATFSRNKIKNFTEYVDDWDNWGQQISNYLGTTDIAFSPDVVAGSKLSWQPADAFSVNLTAHSVGKQYIDNTSSENRKLNAYFFSNLKADYHIPTNLFKELTLSVMVNNIFNAMYESNAWVYSYYESGVRKKMDGYYPQAGINYLVGIRARF